MCPPADSEKEELPICISWLRGWPHMARPGGLRLTFVPGMQPLPRSVKALQHYETERRRSLGRCMLMALGEYEQIRAHPEYKRPIAGGAVHSHPEQEEQMHRDYDRRAYASLTELFRFESLTRQMNVTAVQQLGASFIDI